MTENLFEGFESVSKKAWKEKIIKDLKGKDFDDTLLWDSKEGVVVEPVYHAEDLKQLIENYDEAVLEITDTDANWQIIEQIKVEKVGEANKAALTALNNGAEAIVYNLQGKLLNQAVVEDLIKDILLDVASVSITNFKNGLSAPITPKVFLQEDMITSFLKKQKSIQNEDFSNWETQLKLSNENSFFVDLAVYQNAGAKIIEQLAFGLAITNEYLNKLSEEEIKNLSLIQFQLAVGSNFFFEIAKLRAARKLVAVLLKQYDNENVALHITATTSQIDKSKQAVYTNMLRNTSACMSAIIGGANAVFIAPHKVQEEGLDSGKRWSKNISHLLRNESFFNDVSDVAKGSYYIESVTDNIAEKAWALFKDIEEKGGFLEAWKQGEIASIIKENKQDQIELFKKGEKVMVGVNKYNNQFEPSNQQDFTDSNVLEAFRLEDFYSTTE